MILYCHSCDNPVVQPTFDLSTEEGRRDYTEWSYQVDNHEGKSPTMCNECIEFFTKIHAPKVVNDEPEVIRQFRGIKDTQSCGGVKDKDGHKHMIDLFSASAVIALWDGLKKEDNRQKYLDKCECHPVLMAKIAFKILNKIAA
jgi:Zn-dependent metalloprotease